MGCRARKLPGQGADELADGGAPDPAPSATSDHVRISAGALGNQRPYRDHRKCSIAPSNGTDPLRSQSCPYRNRPQ